MAHGERAARLSKAPKRQCALCGQIAEIGDDELLQELRGLLVCGPCAEEQENPAEGDYVTEDHEHWYQYGKLVVTGDEQAVRRHMNQEKFWPNIWFISDHGNAHLIGGGE